MCRNDTERSPIQPSALGPPVRTLESASARFFHHRLHSRTTDPRKQPKDEIQDVPDLSEPTLPKFLVRHC